MANYGGRNATERRRELAQAKGFRSFHEYRKASDAERIAANRRLAALRPSYRATGAVTQSEKAATRRPRLVSLGGDLQILHSMSDRELLAFMRRAGRAELRLYAALTLRPKNGRADVRARIWTKGGADPTWAYDTAKAFGSAKLFLVDQLLSAGDGYPLGAGWTLVAVELRSGMAIAKAS